MQAGEEPPLHAANLHTLRFLAKAAIALHCQRCLEIVAAAVVIVGIGIPRQAAPLVVRTCGVIEVHVRADVGRLVVSSIGVLALGLVVVVCEVEVSDADEGLDGGR